MPQHQQESENAAVPSRHLPIADQDTTSHPAAPAPVRLSSWDHPPTHNQSIHLSLFGLPLHKPLLKQDALSAAAPPDELLSGSLSLSEQNTLPVPAVSRPVPGVPDLSFPQQTLPEPLPNQSPQIDQLLSQAMAFPPAPLERTTDKQAGIVGRVLRAGLVRLQEPQPEGLLTRGMQAVRAKTGLGAVPLLALADAFGLLLISGSYYVSIWGYDYTLVELCFLIGLLVMFVPNLVHVLSRTPTRLERICLLTILAGSSYFIQFMNSPLHFSGFDEFLHSRTADDILRTSHLFSENSMLPVSPYYPGLEIVTNAISTTTGLSTFYAGNIVIAAARLLMVVGLFLFYEHITNSSRMASISMIIYMVNPHFLFFDTLYNYETLSLPLAILMMYVLVRYGNADKNHRWVFLCAWLILLAVTITHHMTSYFFDGLFLLWTVVSFFKRDARDMRMQLLAITVAGLVLSLAYAFLLPHNPVWSYLSQYFGGSFEQLQKIITGNLVARPLFTSSAQVAPLWDRVFMTSAVVLVTFSLPFGLLVLQRLHNEDAAAITFGIASLSYPLTQAFRFTSFGTEITDRAAAFLFLPIAYVLTMLITHFWPTRRLTWRAITLVTGAITLIFLGGITVGSGPNLSAIPGPYLVVADARSVEPEGIEAATWSLAHLGPNNRIAADRINQMLLSTFGDQRMVTRLGDNVDASPIFFTPTFDASYVALLQYGAIHYLVVDTRISTALPLEGLYFENDHPTGIIKRQALTKFSTMTGVNRLFDSGDIVLYDTGPLLNGASP